ncbi:MAG: ClbS/DfsB family four-helix bundle protein [Spirochaetales bacterium]|nr:ClbS/DfsB family four-helix bundle protein [Spirochaetales bacterium]
MARPATKKDLLTAAETGFSTLWQTIETMKSEALAAEFDFSADEKKKEAHWGRDKNLRDVLVHLYEWHQLLLHWVRSNQSRKDLPFLPEPYTWKTYGEMNTAFWKKHQSTDLETAEDLLKTSHAEVLDCIDQFTNDELFVKKHFNWTGTTSLGSYCVSATSSHYDWAVKKLKAHNRKF